MRTINYFRKWYFLFLPVYLLTVFSALAQGPEGISQNAATFLTISPNARQVSMGEAFTGFANDVSALRYNVGGLGMIPHTNLGFYFHNWIEDTQQGAVAAAFPLSFGTVAFDLHYFDEGTLLQLDKNFKATGREFSNKDLALTLGYGYKFAISRYQLSVGSGLRYVQQNLAGRTDRAFGMDVGMLLKMNFLSAGFTVQNLSLSKMQFAETQHSLPQTYRGGIGFQFAPSQVLQFNFDTDVAFMKDQELRYYAGGEAIISDLLALRGGYKLHDWEATRWSAGFGLRIPMEWLGHSRMELAYAYSPIDDFDTNAHRFSLVFDFGVLTPETAKLYDEQRLTRLIYEEKKIEQMNEQMREELDAAKRARLAAEKAQVEAEESQKRTRELEEVMKQRLDEIQGIAATSEGKIEVTPVTETEIQVSMRINFDFDSAVIRPEEIETIEKVAQILNTYPESRFHIEGHTDWVGTDEYNIRLSERRVKSVMSFLSTQETVAPERFFMPVGYGESRPVDTNETKEGRFRNRRVDFVLYTQDAIPPIPEGTAIREIVAVDDYTVQIICNGIVSFKDYKLVEPARIVIDFPNTFLLFDQKKFEFNNTGPFSAARTGFHSREAFSRIVLDLKEDVPYSIDSYDNIIQIQAQ